MKIYLTNFTKFSLLVFYVINLMLFSCKTTSNTKSSQKNGFNENSYKYNFHEAGKEMMSANYDKAIELYNNCLQMKSNSAVSMFALSSIYLEKKDLQTALTYSKKSVETNPDNLWYQIQLAEIYYLNNDLINSEKVYYELSKKYPNEYFLYEELISLNKSIPDLHKLITVYQNLSAKLSLTEDQSFELYDLYLKAGSFNEAEKLLNKMLTDYPDNIDVKILNADFCYAKGEIKLANDIYAELIKQNPNDSKIFLSLASFYKMTGNTTGFLEVCRTIFKFDDIPVQTKLDILITDIGQIAGKDKFGEFLLILGTNYPDDYKIQVFSGEFSLNNGNKKDALIFFSNAFKISKESEQAIEKLFALQTGFYKYADLLRDTEEVSELFPNHAVIQFYAALALKNIENFKDAIKLFNIANELAFDNKNLKDEILIHLADSYAGLNDFENMTKIYEKLISANPSDLYFKNHYAYSLAKYNKNLTFAGKLLEECLISVPTSPEYNLSFSKLLFAQGNYTKALETIQISFDKLPENPVCIEDYADILFKMGKKNEAIELWKKSYNISQKVSKSLNKKIISESL